MRKHRAHTRAVPSVRARSDGPAATHLSSSFFFFVSFPHHRACVIFCSAGVILILDHSAASLSWLQQQRRRLKQFVLVRCCPLCHQLSARPVALTLLLFHHRVLPSSRLPVCACVHTVSPGPDPGHRQRRESKKLPLIESADKELGHWSRASRGIRPLNLSATPARACSLGGALTAPTCSHFVGFAPADNRSQNHHQRRGEGRSAYGITQGRDIVFSTRSVDIPSHKDNVKKKRTIITAA